MGKLREQMKGDLELRGLSRRTQEIYLSQVRDFSRHFNRSPLHLGERQIKEYLLYLIREKRASQIYVNMNQKDIVSQYNKYNPGDKLALSIF